MSFEKLVTSQFEQALTVHQELSANPTLAKQLSLWAIASADALESGGAVFFAGNGGSFADAQHMAAELTGKMGRMRRPLAGIALGANNSSMSAIGNDFGFEFSFSREFEALHRPNSLVIGFSTSGNSMNLIRLARSAKQLGAPMLCLTGASGGQIAGECETLRVPSERTERIQELHTLIGHTLCLCIEEAMGLSEEPFE